MLQSRLPMVGLNFVAFFKLLANVHSLCLHMFTLSITWHYHSFVTIADILMGRILGTKHSASFNSLFLRIIMV